METRHAWYMIGTPSPGYAQTFREFDLAHKLTYVILSSCLQDHQVTVSSFWKRIQREYPPDVVQSFGDRLQNRDQVNIEFIINECGINDL